MIHDSRCNLQSFRVAVTTADYFVRINQAADTGKVFLIDDFAIIFIIQRCRSKLFFNLFLNLADQFIFNFLITVDIIWFNTGLTAVEIFSEYNPSGCQFQVGTFFYDTPSSRVTGVRCADAFDITSRPTFWLPVKKI